MRVDEAVRLWRIRVFLLFQQIAEKTNHTGLKAGVKGASGVTALKGEVRE